MERLPTLLLVYAHPDDESFGPGGTIARCADAGVRVVLACATLGEAGKCGDPPVCTPAELPEVRRRELDCAARVLGIATVELLGYRDRELERVDPDEGAGRVLDLLRRYRPDVVITFPPGGISGHPDHVAVCGWAGRAVRAWRAEGGTATLFYHTAPFYPRFAGRGPFHPLDVRFHVRVDVSAWLPRKIAALRCHRSQHLSSGPLLARLEDPAAAAAPWAAEHYYQVDPPRDPHAPPGSDLFDPPLAV